MKAWLVVVAVAALINAANADPAYISADDAVLEFFAKNVKVNIVGDDGEVVAASSFDLLSLLSRVQQLEGRMSVAETETGKVAGIETRVGTLEGADLVAKVAALEADTLDTRLDALEGAEFGSLISGLDTRLGDAEAETAKVSGIDARVNALEDLELGTHMSNVLTRLVDLENADLITRVAAIEADTLDTRLDVLEGADFGSLISGLDTRLGDAEVETAKVSGIDTRVGALEDLEFGTHAANVLTRLVDLENADLITRVAAIEGDTLDTRLDVLEGADFGSLISGLDARLGSAETETAKVSGISNRVGALEADALDTRLNALEEADFGTVTSTLNSDVTGLASRVGDLEVASASLTDTVTALESTGIQALEDADANAESRLDAIEAVHDQDILCASQGKIHDGSGNCVSLSTTEIKALPALGDTECTAALAGALAYDAAAKLPAYCSAGRWQLIGDNSPGSIANPAASCQVVYDEAASPKSGNYFLVGADGSSFEAYCLMTEDGAFQICYTTRNDVHVRTETSGLAQFPNHGYRSDCNNVEFNEVVYINHDASDATAHFRKDDSGSVTMAETDYFTTGAAFGSWTGSGAASSGKYQLGVCDHDSELAPGIWFSAIQANGGSPCWKACNSWCGDSSATYFRADSPHTWGEGFAFGENGHTDVADKLVSVGIRFKAKAHVGTAENPAIDCADLKAKAPDAPSGMYVLQPKAGVTTTAYCDQEHDGGGWTYCYTDNHVVHIASETTGTFPYPYEGYRADCRDIAFNEVMFIRESDKSRAWMKHQSGTQFKWSNTNYFASGDSFGLWTPYGVVAGAGNYQIGVCDHDETLAPGLWASGYTNCYKACNSWCGDTSTAYFRMDSHHSCYNGVAFNENGHQGCSDSVSNKDMTVAIRRV